MNTKKLAEKVAVVTGASKGIGADIAKHLAAEGAAVEVVEGTNHRLLAVQTGLFADGQVEVTGTGLRAGMKVVTTS